MGLWAPRSSQAVEGNWPNIGGAGSDTIISEPSLSAIHVWNRIFSFVIELLSYFVLSLQDLITWCLAKDPTKRPTARELLFHKVLFEVHSLKLLSGHVFVKNASKSSYMYKNKLNNDIICYII